MIHADISPAPQWLYAMLAVSMVSYALACVFYLGIAAFRDSFFERASFLIRALAVCALAYGAFMYEPHLAIAFAAYVALAAVNWYGLGRRQHRTGLSAYGAASLIFRDNA